MTLKNKISILISVIFSTLFGIASFVIYFLFSDFRKEEFERTLKNKALSTIKLFSEVKEEDNHLLRIIDRNNINKLYDEKTLLFDDNYKLIYSSLDDTEIEWNKNDLIYLKKNNFFF